MIKRHWSGILQWKLSSINNGILEGLNSVVMVRTAKQLKILALVSYAVV
jgi:hypothetical protein